MCEGDRGGLKDELVLHPGQKSKGLLWHPEEEKRRRIRLETKSWRLCQGGNPKICRRPSFPSSQGGRRSASEGRRRRSRGRKVELICIT